MVDDGERFVHDLQYSVSRLTVFDAVMRVRASTGEIQHSFDYGNLYLIEVLIIAICISLTMLSSLPHPSLLTCN